VFVCVGWGGGGGGGVCVTVLYACSTSMQLMPSDMHTEHVRSSLEATLADLKTPYVDLYLLHWPYALVHKPSKFPVPSAERLGYDPARIESVWRILEQAVDDGLIRSLGVSNFSPSKIERLQAAGLRHPVSCNQLELHPALPAREWVRWCQDRGIVVTCYMPLGSPSRPPTCRHASDPDLLNSPVIMSIAAAHGATPAQVLLRWALDRGTVPLPKSVTPARIAENAAVLTAAWQLSSDESAAIDGLSAGGPHRFMRGDNVAVKTALHGGHWRHVWDEEPQDGDGPEVIV
jgi:alcohol dehydrogenase (NADP+)